MSTQELHRNLNSYTKLRKNKYIVYMYTLWQARDEKIT